LSATRRLVEQGRKPARRAREEGLGGLGLGARDEAERIVEKGQAIGAEPGRARTRAAPAPATLALAGRRDDDHSGRAARRRAVALAGVEPGGDVARQAVGRAFEDDDD